MDNNGQPLLSLIGTFKNIAIKKRALDGNLTRILEKVIRGKLSLDQNLLDRFKVTTQFKQYFFHEDGLNLPK